MAVITIPENMYATSRLSILLQGVIPLPDAASCDNEYYPLAQMHNLDKANAVHIHKVWM